METGMLDGVQGFIELVREYYNKNAQYIISGAEISPEDL